MPSLLLPQIRALLSDVSQLCEVTLNSDDYTHYAAFKWWLADGVFNHAPHGQFNTDLPYLGEHDDRTVRDFLEQAPATRYEGVQTLMDLFSEEVVNHLSEWAQSVVRQRLGDQAPSEDEWENVYVPEWENILNLTGLHPKSENGFWDDFLDVPLHVVVEPLRFAAAQASLRRRGKLARMVSRFNVEEAMRLTIANRVDAERATRTNALPWNEWLFCLLESLEAQYEVEVALFSNSSSHLVKLVSDAQDRQRFIDRFPLPAYWSESLQYPGFSDMI